jgi:SNF2 family DNA or RNA helicase
MLIDLLNNTLTITEENSSKLKPYQISQISFWGFRKISEKNLYESSSQNIEVTLLKLIGYLNNENIPYSLSVSCQEYMSEINQKINELKIVKDLGEEFKKGKFEKDNFKQLISFINNNIPRQLKEHQLKAAFHLYLVRNGANFSVPGSGKTAVVLSVYEKLKFEKKVNMLFVVGPPACFSPWKTEFQLTLGRKPDYRILSGGEQILRKSEYYNTVSRKGELYLTTYQTLLNDQDEVINFLNQQNIEAFLVIDEAHYIKQIGGNWANAVLRISKYAKYRCILTGTPLPNSYTDIFNLFDFLWPNNNPLEPETKIKIKLLEEEKRDIELVKQVMEKDVGPLFYRVRKSDLGLLPQIFNPPIILSMNKYEKIIYNAIENKIRNYSEKDYLKNIDLVAKLRRGRMMRLRQSISYIKLLTTVLENYDEDIIGDISHLGHIIYNYDNLEIPAKLEYLKRFINNLFAEKQKVVIWANFVGTLELIVKYLTQAGFYCKLIYGKTPIEQSSIQEEETREKILDEFVDPKSGLDILVANPAACAESISLHKTCHNAVYYDLSYNCAQYLQSMDRIHRVGGSEELEVNYYFLQYENTIDQDIKINLDKKAKKMNDIIEKDYNIYSLDMFEEDDEIEAYERLFGGK